MGYMKGYFTAPKIAASSSRKAVSISSARTTKRFAWFKIGNENIGVYSVHRRQREQYNASRADPSTTAESVGAIVKTKQA